MSIRFVWAAADADRGHGTTQRPSGYFGVNGVATTCVPSSTPCRRSVQAPCVQGRGQMEDEYRAVGEVERRKSTQPAGRAWHPSAQWVEVLVKGGENGYQASNRAGATPSGAGEGEGWMAGWMDGRMNE